MSDVIVAQLLRFRPLLKQTLWGGRRLGESLGKPIGDGNDYAESWEVVDHGEDQSVVLDGPLAGESLHSLFQDQRRWLMGQRWTAAFPDAATFPLLFKFLDCNRVLSVQVHPDDAYGATMTPPDLGKTEAWVVLHSEPDSVIYAGLKEGVTRDQLARWIESGETEQALHRFHPEPGDCVFIPAGTVHALGGGLLIAEIQQSSNTTFRLFDWNRTDAAGKSRPLHIEQSLAVTDYQRGPVQPIRRTTGGAANLVECDKFTLRRLQSPADGDRQAGDASYPIAGDDQCHLLACINGEATLQWQDSQNSSCSLSKGQTMLLPAAMPEVSLNVPPGANVLQMTPASR